MELITNQRFIHLLPHSSETIKVIKLTTEADTLHAIPTGRYPELEELKVFTSTFELGNTVSYGTYTITIQPMMLIIPHRDAFIA